MKAIISAEVDMDAATYWSERNNPGFLEIMAKALRMKNLEKVSEEVEDGTVVQNIVNVPSMPVPGPGSLGVPRRLRSAFRGRQFAFTDVVRFPENMTGPIFEADIITYNNFTKMAQISGHLCVEPTGPNSCRQTLTAYITVKLPFFGGFLERLGIAGMRDGYKKLPDMVAKWKETRHLWVNSGTAEESVRSAEQSAISEEIGAVKPDGRFDLSCPTLSETLKQVVAEEDEDSDEEYFSSSERSSASDDDDEDDETEEEAVPLHSTPDKKHTEPRAKDPPLGCLLAVQTPNPLRCSLDMVNVSNAKEYELVPDHTPKDLPPESPPAAKTLRSRGKTQKTKRKKSAAQEPESPALSAATPSPLTPHRRESEDDLVSSQSKGRRRYASKLKRLLCCAEYN